MSKPVVTLGCLTLALLCVVVIDDHRRSGRLAAGAKERAPVAAEAVSCDIPYELLEPRFLDPRRQSMERILRKPITIELREQPLKETLAQLQGMTSARLVFSPDSIREGQNYDEALVTPISLSAKDMSFKQVLRRILSPLNLVAVVAMDDIWIEDAGKSCDQLSTKLYPVADLITIRTHDHVEIMREPLIAQLQTYLQPESWDEVGGPGSIRFEPITMSFVVRQTEAVHDEMEMMLQTLREMRCRLPKLLHAANAPSVDEIRKAENSLARADRELAEVEKGLRQLEGLDPKKLPPMPGTGMFDIPGPNGATEAIVMNARGSRLSTIKEARDLALRAMRIAVRFEGLDEEDDRKQAEQLQNEMRRHLPNASTGTDSPKSE